MVICQKKGASGIGLSIIFGTTLFYSRILQQVYEEATKKCEQDPSDSNLNTLNEAKEILVNYYEEKTRGVIIRARA